MEWAVGGRNTLSLDLMRCQGATFCDTVYDMQPYSIFYYCLVLHNCKTATALMIIIKKNNLMVREDKGGFSAQGCRRDVFCVSHAASYFIWLIERIESSGDGYYEEEKEGGRWYCIGVLDGGERCHLPLGFV
jgi:hypothetical protein